MADELLQPAEREVIADASDCSIAYESARDRKTSGDGRVAFAEPKIESPALDARFADSARAMGLDPDQLWRRGHIAYAWRNSRQFIESFCGDLHGREVLEVGSNLGITAIIARSLGANVTGIDVDPRWVELARHNAARYGVGGIDFIQTIPGEPLPFADTRFDTIFCISVLECVEPEHLGALVKELDRVLRPGGTLLVMATSNRLWPREQHSHKWGWNYVPRGLDRWFGWHLRGIFPSDVTRHLRGWTNLVLADRGAAYWTAWKARGDRRIKLFLLRLVAPFVMPLGIPVSVFTPSFVLALRKPR